jgi:hypothetical protein
MFLCRKRRMKHTGNANLKLETMKIPEKANGDTY